jgi:hypothetical protein
MSRSGSDVAASVGDQFADAGTAETLGLSVLARGLGVGEGGEKFQPAAPAVGVKPLWGRGHAAEVAERDNIRQGQVRCATTTARAVDGKGLQSWTFTTSASRWW